MGDEECADEETSLNYFNRDRIMKKANVVKKSRSNEEDKHPVDVEVEEEEEDDEESEEVNSDSEVSEDELDADLIESLTAEEREFLGYKSSPSKKALNKGRGNDIKDSVETDKEVTFTNVKQSSFKRFTAGQKQKQRMESTKDWTHSGSSTQYKVVASPHVMCVEALDESIDETTENNTPKDGGKVKENGPKSKSGKKRKILEFEEEESPKMKKKESRMTTNKMKTGSRYYDTANVKNKNRNKKKKNSVYDSEAGKKSKKMGTKFKKKK